MNWYKKANEFVGADAPLGSGTHISDIPKRNIDHQYMPPSMSQRPVGVEEVEVDGRVYHSKCEKCGLELEEFEKLDYFFVNDDGEKEEAYSCSNCGHKNHYSKKITKKKNDRKKRRIRRRRKAGVEVSVKIAATPATTFTNWPDSNNPANTPMGRLDLSEDQRIIPWHRLKDGFGNEWDEQKQKKHDEDFEVIKVKGKDGKYKFVRVKSRTTGGDAVQPSNVYTQKGRVKKQKRYNEDNRDKKQDNPGAWPHNRNLTGPGSGGYQLPYSQNLDTDMREKVIDWYDHLVNRGQYSLSRPY